MGNNGITLRVTIEAERVTYWGEFTRLKKTGLGAPLKIL
jgi:hypothetical protein